MLCEYGCGLESKFTTKGGRYICSPSPNSCKALRKKNAEKISIAHSEGRCVTSHLSIVRSSNKGKLYCKEEYFSIADKPKKHKTAIRNTLLKERGHKCESCENYEWMGEQITIELEHVNGDNKDNRRENLKLLCPNCHAQTPTWRRKKSKFK